MARRITGILMLGLEAVVLWRTMGYAPIATLAVLVALLGCWPRLQVDWGYRKKYLSGAAIGLVYLVWWWLDLQYLNPSRSSQFENNLGLAGALGAMMIQAQQYFWRDNRGLPNYFPFIGALAMAFATDHYLLSSTERYIIYPMIMAFGVLAVIFFAAGHRRGSGKTYATYRYTLVGVCVIFSLGLASGTAWVIGQSEQAVGRMLAKSNLLQNQLVLGNSRNARLNSMSDIKGHNFDHIALEIVADSSPGYLRGQVYGNYKNQSWDALPEGGAPEPVPSPPEGYVARWTSAQLFPVANGAAERVADLVVYPDAAINRALFTPAETGWVGRPDGTVRVNEAQVVESSQSNNGHPYHIVTSLPSPVEVLTPEARALYLGLPDDLAPRIKALSDTICAGQNTTLGKANAVTQYFSSNYDYVIGIEVPRGEDPMEYFLFSDPLPDAHCEFFATGAALLLRAAGVPTRYVTGVGVWEQHPFADYWVARNRDAHAWVEAWDAKEGWFIVEATPASGLPEAGEDQATNLFRDFWAMVVLNVKRMITAVREGAWATLLSVAQALLVGLISFLRVTWWIFLVLLATAVALWKACRRWRDRARGSGPLNTHLQAMHSQIATMDAWVGRKHRLKRAAHVTPHAFAREIEQHTGEGNPLARWYRHWAEVRYGNPVDETAVANLEREQKSAQRNAKHESRR